MPFERQEASQIIQSPDMAWIMGTLSGHRLVHNKTGHISLGNKNEQVQHEFIRLGEQVFGVEIPYRPVWTNKDNKPITYLAPSFYSISIARGLGDLSRTQFHRTIREKHNWILEDQTCTLRYTEGLFEARGNIYKRFESESKDIMLQTSIPYAADFIAEVLTKLGVTPTIIKMRRGPELITKGVTISTLPEQKKFAELIHSVDPKKEEQLEEFRNASLEGVITRVKSKDELINEWRKMTNILGHPPNSSEIRNLRKEGITKWASQTYTSWFGETGKDKRFSVVRKQLISIVNPELILQRLDAQAKRNQRKIKVSLTRERKLRRDRERKQRQAELDQALQPSRELAWVLGILGVGGNVNLENGSITLSSSIQTLQDAYINTAGNLFRTNLTWQTISSESGEYQIPQFNNTLIARRLGDLRRSNWPTTITEKHSWLIENQDYIWSFLSGIFDDKGLFSGTNSHELIIPTSYRPVANFITKLMVDVGIQNPAILKRSRGKDGVQSVAICNIKDLKIFANNVHSVIPTKEQQLECIRINNTRKSRATPQMDENEMIVEWRRLYELLGHPPNVTDINELRYEGNTKWSAGVYARVFGATRTNKGRSYKQALVNLASACGLESDPKSVRYRRPDSKYKIVKDPTNLVDQYRQLRESTLNKDGRLPNTGDFDRGRRVGLVSYSRVTFANYFGEGNFTKAIINLEKILEEKASS